MQISIISLSFLASAFALLLGNLMLPILNHNYCLLYEKHFLERAENIIEKNRTDLEEALKQIQELNANASLNIENASSYFPKLTIAVSYNDLYQKEHLANFKLKIENDKY